MICLNGTSDYSSGFPAKFIIEKDKIYTENSNLACGVGELKLDKFEPFPRIHQFQKW